MDKMNKKGKLVSCLTVIMLLIVSSVYGISFFKKKKDLQTKSLFMQTKFQRIELPPSDTLGASKGQHVLVEQVTYNHADNHLTKKENNTVGSGKISEVQNLNEVEVTAKSRFAPEHNGKVSVDFIIKVPKEMVSPQWRLTLLPKLLHNDSIVELDKIVLRGSEFKSKQQNDSAKYKDYLKSIIDKSKYDSVFLNKKSVDNDILKFQTAIYDKYQEDWSSHKWHLDKMNEFKKKELKLDKEKKIYNSTKYAEYARKVNEEKMKHYIQDEDTTGVYAKHMYDYDKEANKKAVEIQKKKDKLFKKQLAYRTTDFPLQDMPNKNFRQQDSINIAQYSYDFKKIAENQMKDENKENVLKELVKFDEKESVRLDTLVSTSKDFVYSYRQEYPVAPGLKKIRIMMDAQVESIDQSGYYSPSTDTLSYFISSLAQLADTSMVYKVSNLKKVAYNQVTAFLKYPLNKNSVFNINYSDNKNQLLNAIMFMDAVKGNKVYAVDSVTIEVSRSLNGKFEDNTRIAAEQANALKKYLEQQYKDTDFANKFVIDPKGEDWNTLVKEIKANDKIVNKDAILNLLANARIPDDCKEEIKRKYKSDYAIIQNSIYPYMDKTEIIFNIHRTDMTEDKEVRKEYKGDNYKEGLRLLQEREYWKALKLLADYGDYNTAVCLVCLGYNAPAYELLEKLPKTAQNYYLKAIVANRLEKNDEAVQCLKEAFKLDPSKRYRIGLDAEVKAIVAKNNIN